VTVFQNLRVCGVLCVVVLQPLCAALASPVEQQATAGLSDQWYIGLGGGIAFLQPNLDKSNQNSENGDPPLESVEIEPDEKSSDYGTLTLGRDLGRLASLELRLHSLGSLPLTNGDEINFAALDGALLYRFYDTRDHQLVPGQVALALFGMASIGTIRREIDTDIKLQDRSEFYMGFGGGAELFLHRNFSLRLHAMILDDDVQFAGLSMITRFGGSRSVSPDGQSVSAQPNPATASTEENEPAPVSDNVVGTTPAQEDATAVDAPGVDANTTQQLPEVVTLSPEEMSSQTLPGSAQDDDGDGVENSADECNDSMPGYPIRKNGCPLLEGVLSAVRFSPGTATLSPGADRQLDALAKVLKRHPDTRVQIFVHTDTSTSEREQAILTRSRIRTLGTYLVDKNISANRLILRPMGGSRPVYNNDTSGGRALNNRVEILEHR